jgi:hypothetical protein
MKKETNDKLFDFINEFMEWIASRLDEFNAKLKEYTKDESTGNNSNR